MTRLFVGWACVSLAMTAGVALADAQRFPDVVDVKVKDRGGQVYDFDVTVSSPYDTPARYADAFRVKDASGKVFGERILLHDHQSEQPFTRDLYGVTIPDGIGAVVIEGRDQKYGWGGKTFTAQIPRR